MSRSKIPSGAGHVLLIEADIVSRKGHIQLLERCGYRVHVVANGEQALFQLRTGQAYQFILMDLQLPDMSAEYMAKLFYRHGNALDAKLAVFIEDLVKLDTLYRCMDAGIFWIIRKPMEIAHIEELVDEEF